MSISIRIQMLSWHVIIYQYYVGFPSAHHDANSISNSWHSINKCLFSMRFRNNGVIMIYRAERWRCQSLSLQLHLWLFNNVQEWKVQPKTVLSQTNKEGTGGSDGSVWLWSPREDWQSGFCLSVLWDCRDSNMWILHSKIQNSILFFLRTHGILIEIMPQMH